MISVVCCCNNIDQYESMLHSLHNQDVEYEMVCIDNRLSDYKSAACALNKGGGISKGKILVFVHQDIIFKEEDSLRRLVEAVKLHPLSVIGIHGASRGVRKNISGLKEAQTLDECCVAMERSTWEKYKFNEILCDGWHLYVVELCLRLGREGAFIGSADFGILHLSTGNVDGAYMKTFKLLMKQYKDVKYIATTCKSMPNLMCFFYTYYVIWRMKKLFFGNLHIVYSIKKLIRRLDYQG